MGRAKVFPGMVAPFSVLVLAPWIGVAQTPSMIGPHPVYMGQITPYSQAVAMDSSLRPARNSIFDGFSGESPLSDNSSRLLRNYKPAFQRTDPVSLALADTVVLGTVTKATSWLSNDHTTIYTEDLVKVSSVLLDGTHGTMAVGAVIALEHPGGLIKFSSGITIQRSTQGQSLPMHGYSYLLCLKYSPAASAFKIVSALALVEPHTYILEDVYTGSDGALALGVYPMTPSQLVNSITSAVGSASKNK